MDSSNIPYDNLRLQQEYNTDDLPIDDDDDDQGEELFAVRTTYTTYVYSIVCLFFCYSRSVMNQLTIIFKIMNTAGFFQKIKKKKQYITCLSFLCCDDRTYVYIYI